MSSIDLRGAQVLVTGGNGFLGRRVVQQLRAAGAVVGAPPSKELDLLSRDAVRAALRARSWDVVIHLAARVGGIGANEKNAAVYFHDNLIMGTQLIDEAWRARVKKLVAVGTVCAYPKHAPVPFRESSLWDGYPEETNAPYGLAKKMLLVQAQAYRHQYGFDGVVVFPANLYGPGDNFDVGSSHVVPAIIRKIATAQQTQQRTVTLWGDGTPTRELFYVDDCAEAVVAVAARYDSGEALNLGTGVETSITALASIIGRLMDFDGSFLWDPQRPNGQPRRWLDVSRARDLLGFSARTALEDGLRATIAWWREHGVAS